MANQWERPNPARGNHHVSLAASIVLALVAFVALLPISASTAQASAAQTNVEQATAPEQGVVRPGGATLHDIPDGEAVAELAAVSFVTVFGRSADSNWLVVATVDGQSGWVQTSDIIVYNIATLPVMTGEQEGDPATPAASAPEATAAATEAANLPTNTPTRGATATPTATNTPLPTPTPTPSPTATRTPTYTPTPAPTFTPTPEPTPTALPATATRSAVIVSAASTVAPRTSIVGVVGVKGGTLLESLGDNSGTMLPVAATVTLVARSEDGEWLQAQMRDGTQGWIAVDNVLAFGTEDLPVAGEGTAETTAVEATTDAPPASTTETDETPEASSETANTETTSAEADTAAPAASLEGERASVLMTGSRLNIRSGPGTAFAIVGKADPDEEVVLLARTAAADWLQIAQQTPGSAIGWVSAEFIETSADLSQLPEEAVEVRAAEQIATVTPQDSDAEPTQDPAATSLETPAAEDAVTATATPIATVAAAAPVVRTAPTGTAGYIVFQDGLGGIWLYNLDSGALNTLTSGYDPAFSPDGRTVVFTRADGGNNGIYTINIDGSDERKIWGEGQILRAPKFSPDGERIVYSRLTGEYKCFNLQFIGCISLKQLIAQFPAAIIPEVSRAILGDAERLTFPNWGISRIGAQGGDFRDIAALDSAVAPDWNEAGIVYQSTAGIEITEDTPTGDTYSVIAENWDHDPDWQPDGGQILFQSKEGSHWEIWRVAPDGGGLVALTRPETALVDKMPYNVAPAWSFDGSQIVYLSSRDSDEEHGAWRLWIMNTDGSNKRPLDLGVTIEYAFASEQVADWGPPLE